MPGGESACPVPVECLNRPARSQWLVEIRTIGMYFGIDDAAPRALSAQSAAGSAGASGQRRASQRGLSRSPQSPAQPGLRCHMCCCGPRWGGRGVDPQEQSGSPSAPFVTAPGCAERAERALHLCSFPFLAVRRPSHRQRAFRALARARRRVAQDSTFGGKWIGRGPTLASS